MTNQELVVKLKTLVGEEKKTQAEILRYLREVDSRILYAEMGYPSLFEFCRRELGYSEGAAGRRIASMRLMRDLPETEMLFEQGALTLETMHQVQSHFRVEKPSQEEKREIVRSVLHQSKAEVKRILKVEEKTPTLRLSERTMQKLEKLKIIYGTSSLEKIIERMADKALSTPPAEPKRVKGSNTRYVPQSLKRAVFRRDQARCTYPGCTASRYLQFDQSSPTRKVA